MRGGLRILVNSQHHIRHVAPIFPVAQSTGSHDADRAIRTEHEVQAGEEMHEQITSDACAVVAIVTPTKETNRIERHLWRFTEEALPINSLCRSVRGQRILPSAERAVAIPPRLDQVQFADGAGVVEFLRLLVNDRTDALTAHLQNLVC